MKKFIALVLALIMTFSLCSVAFAEGEADTTAPETETTVPAEGEGEEEAGELDWLLDLPFWTVGPAFKFAKIALKLVKVFVKVAAVFGIVDTDEIVQQIIDMIANAENGEVAPEETPVEDTTAPTAA